ISQDIVNKARERMTSDLQRLVEKQKITSGKKEAVLQKITFTSEAGHCKANLVIEAVIENAEVKTGLFNQLAAINDEDTIFASNTSSLSISAVAKGISHPERVAGLHFFNPAPLMKLVEVVKGEQTSVAVIE